MPRLILALGVIVWALLRVLLSRRRRPTQPVRQSPRSEDPVADALADAQPVSRLADEETDANDLRWIVSVEEMEVNEDGYNTVVELDDPVLSYADVYADGLEDALADQPGIDAVDHVDREIVLVRSELSLPDVHAATIRALLSINQDPRPVPRNRLVQPAVMNAAAAGVATVMADHGFAGRLRMSPEHDESHSDPNDLHGPGFYRVFPDDRLVQVVGLRDGVGYHDDDGSIVNVHLRLSVAVIEIATTDPTEFIELDRGCEVVAGERILSRSYNWVAPTVDGNEHVPLGEAVALCESTASRAAIVDRWVSGLPWYVPDKLAWEAADTAARWGFRKHARDLSKHSRKLPQSAMVAAKHGL